MMTHMIPAEFHGLKLDIIDHAGRRWLTAEQAGLALGYNEANASSGVRNLYNRHADEFTEADSRRINLMRRDGKTSEQLVFSDTGCIKLGFFANTTRAKEFRTWAAKTLAAQSAPVVVQSRPHERGKVRVTRAVERQVLELFAAGYSQKEIARTAGVSVSTVSLLIHAKYRFSPSLGRSECPPDLISAVTARHMEVEAERLATQKDRIAQKFLTSAHNQELAESLEYVGQCALDGSLELLTDDSL